MRGKDLVTAMNEKYLPSKKELMETVITLVLVTFDKKRAKIRPNTHLLSTQAGFDSVGLLEFVLLLEDTFGLSIPDEDLDPDIFYSPETIVAYLCTRLKERE